jgi:hypothetical protein
MAERRKAEAASAAAGGDANLIPLGSRLETAKPAAEPLEPLPEVEWWDARILAEPTSYGAVADGEPAKVTLQHSQWTDQLQLLRLSLLPLCCLRHGRELSAARDGIGGCEADEESFSRSTCLSLCCCLNSLHRLHCLPRFCPVTVTLPASGCEGACLGCSRRCVLLVSSFPPRSESAVHNNRCVVVLSLLPSCSCARAA